jgi:hypothetical protein
MVHKELGDRFGTYMNVGPSIKTSRGIIVFQFFKPHTHKWIITLKGRGGSVDCWIVGYVANYSRKMEQTKTELLVLKMLCERNEVEEKRVRK